ncbi:hypothetical protein UCRNP2_6563 [Neofusicoccum parvum UCRNP2]|uniref:Uncharacterized protein n=1 Tax=Botryosphaeria parva (strain UCR-NP2) TaxID=1287680 RepID=R1EFZ3_BOTPV|nr:hypothetical protein UCRNP2_6563 [Neofusicoccum parvum UCRNP2]
MSAEQLLVAILETCDIKFSSDDHAKIAAKIGGNVTGNAIRQRIQKIRKTGMAGTPKKTANAGGGGDDVGTPTPGKKQRGKANGKAGGKAKSGHSISATADDNDDDDDEESPSKKRGGAGRKRGIVKAEVAEESEPESPTKKVRREREVEELGDGLETSFFDQEDGAYAI